MTTRQETILSSIFAFLAKNLWSLTSVTIPLLVVIGYNYRGLKDDIQSLKMQSEIMEKKRDEQLFDIKQQLSRTTQNVDYLMLNRKQ